MKKKMVSIVLALVLAFSMAACQTENGQKEAESQEERTKQPENKSTRRMWN
ncbi:MAG: hypothetical protein ACLTA7_00905 [Ruminococcus sp.]